MHGKECLTRFRVVRRERRDNIPGWVTFVDLWPRTGRKHQLRIHMASLGHPIVGDERYSEGPGIDPALVFPKWLARGMYLWALELRFRHPATGEAMHFELEQPAKFEGVIGKKPRRRRERPEVAGTEALTEGEEPSDAVPLDSGACVADESALGLLKGSAEAATRSVSGGVLGASDASQLAGG